MLVSSPGLAWVGGCGAGYFLVWSAWCAAVFDWRCEGLQLIKLSANTLFSGPAVDKPVTPYDTKEKWTQTDL